MADIFPYACALRGRSPVPLHGDGFKKISVNLMDRNALISAAICEEISRLLGEISCAAFSLDDQNIVAVFEAKNEKKVSSILQRERGRLERLCYEISGSSGKSPQILFELDKDEAFGGLLLREAARRSLASFLVGLGWISLQGGAFLVFGKLEEGLALETISLDVHLEDNGHIFLLVSPDVTIFHLAKLAEDIPVPFTAQFEQNKFVSAEDYCLQFDDRTIHDFECCVMPSMQHGYALGFSKTLPCSSDKADMDRRLGLWSKQNGIRLSGDCYYVKICLSLDSDEFSWFPSCMILKKAGFFPAVPSLRCSSMLRVVEHFLHDATGWTFCGAGRTDFKEIESDNSTPQWIKAPSLYDSHPSIYGLKTAAFSSLKPENLIKSLRAREAIDRANALANISQAPRIGTEISPATITTQRPVLVPNFKRGKAVTKSRAGIPPRPSTGRKIENTTKGARGIRDSDLQTTKKQSRTRKPSAIKDETKKPPAKKPKSTRKKKDALVDTKKC